MVCCRTGRATAAPRAAGPSHRPSRPPCPQRYRPLTISGASRTRRQARLARLEEELREQAVRVALLEWRLKSLQGRSENGSVENGAPAERATSLCARVARRWSVTTGCAAARGSGSTHPTVGLASWTGFVCSRIDQPDLLEVRTGPARTPAAPDPERSSRRDRFRRSATHPSRPTATRCRPPARTDRPRPQEAAPTHLAVSSGRQSTRCRMTGCALHVLHSDGGMRATRWRVALRIAAA
jgi:hypothetical protein